MLREIERIRGFVIFEVSSTVKKTATIIGFRVFPVKGLGDTTYSSPDFPSWEQAKSYVPWFREIDHVGTIGVYKTLNPLFYICEARGASEEDLAAVRQKYYTLEDAKRMAALENYKRRAA